MSVTMPEILTPEQVGQLLGGVPVTTVRNLARTGRLPSFKIGRLVRFNAEDVAAVLERAAANGETI